MMALSVMEDGGLLSCLVSLDVLTKPSWDCCLQKQWLLAPLRKFTTWPQGRDWACFVAEGQDSTSDVICLRVWEGEGAWLCGNTEDGRNGMVTTLLPLPIRLVTSFEFPT